MTSIGSLGSSQIMVVCFLFFSTEAGILGSSLLFSKAPLLGTRLVSVACDYVLWNTGAASAGRAGVGGAVTDGALPVYNILVVDCHFAQGGKKLSYWAKKNTGPQGWSITIPTFLSDEKLIGPCHID